MNTIGKRLMTARVSTRLTQSEVAERLFVSPQAVSLWERDENYGSSGVMVGKKCHQPQCLC